MPTEPERGDLLMYRRRRYVVVKLIAGMVTLKDARTGEEALANFQLIRWDEKVRAWRA